MNNDLRWRKWPEEKPESNMGCIGILDMDHPAYVICRYHDGILHYPACATYNISHWLPFSALPKPEDKE